VRRALAALLLTLLPHAAPAQDLDTPAEVAAQMMALILEAMAQIAGQRSAAALPIIPGVPAMPGMAAMPGMSSIPGMSAIPGMNSMPGVGAITQATQPAAAATEAASQLTQMGSAMAQPGSATDPLTQLGNLLQQHGAIPKAPANQSVAVDGHLDGLWINEAGEYFAVEDNRFALWAGPNRSIEGTFQLVGSEIHTQLPQGGASQAYRFVHRDDTLVMIDPAQEVLIFRRIRHIR